MGYFHQWGEMLDFPIPFQPKLHLICNLTSDNECPGWVESIYTRFVISNCILATKVEKNRRQFNGLHSPVRCNVRFPVPFQPKLHLICNLTSDYECPGWVESRLVPIMLQILPIILFYFSWVTTYYSKDMCLLFFFTNQLFNIIDTQNHNNSR